jgi:predicted Zn-dependent protease
VAAAIIVGLATGAFFWRRAQATPLTERDVVVLSEFSNTTGEPVFDSTLRAALSIQLEQSPFLKIMGDDQMREGLRLMDRPANERITADVAREICVRMNEKATIGGAIDKLGAAYAVTLQAVHCQNGEALAREQVQAADKEHVLEAVSTAARALRARLGESLASIEKLSLPLNQVTTSSLEALQAFAIGSANLNGGDPLAAVKQLERATSLDQNFAMAWWVLASAYQNAGVGVQGAAIDKAFALRDRLSERERLAIETGYYAQRTGEWDKAADAAELGTKTYPREALPHFVLVGLRTFAGRPDDALHENLEAVRLDPRNAVFTAGLVGVYARLDRFDEAKAVAVKALADPKLDVPVLHLNLLRIAYIQRDEPAVDRELKWFNGNSQDYNAMVAQAANALRLGQRRHAAQLLQQAGETAKRRGVPFGGALVNPLDDALIGNCPPPIGPGMPELVLALCGDPEAALAAADTTSGRTKANGWHMVQLPMVRAAVAMRRKQPEQAIEALKLAVRHDLYQPLLPYLRGQAYLDANRANEAAAEFRKVIDHQGIHWRFNQALPRDTGPLAPVAQVGLARSLALAGDTAGARKAYQDFLALWKDADPDIPILIQAKKDYAALE